MSEQGFRKTQRILSQKEYRQVLNFGRRQKTKYFILFRRENGLPRHRLGLIITKKIANAVGRNHIKRHLREYFRLHYNELAENIPFHDVVFLARKGAEALTVRDIQREIESYYEKNSDRTYHRVSVDPRASVAQ